MVAMKAQRLSLRGYRGRAAGEKRGIKSATSACKALRGLAELREHRWRTIAT
jgi:hypothetical protein